MNILAFTFCDIFMCCITFKEKLTVCEPINKVQFIYVRVF